jgi:crotonobetainyl-CoA:carnitine CoA-transferase CaiB-like acyl-CoA transferase
MMPILRERMAKFSATEISAVFEKNALPFAPITRPQDLFDDPHLNATGGLADIELPDGKKTRAVMLPITLDGQRPGIRRSPPKLGEHSTELLRELGYIEAQIRALSEVPSTEQSAKYV